jgi:hypothetical protein
MHIRITVWRDRFGHKTPLSDLETSHLYHIVKMIWNNVLRPENPFGNVIQWSFNKETYPRAYLQKIFTNGLVELKSRPDAVIASDFLAHVELDKSTKAF